MQVLLDELSALLGRAVSVDDVAGGVVAHSAQTDGGDLFDDARVRAILTRRVPPDVAAWQERHGTTTAVSPVRVPENLAVGVSPRVCFPLLHDGARVGYLWVIEGGRALSDEETALVEARVPALAARLAPEGEPWEALVTGDSHQRSRAREALLASGLRGRVLVVVALAPKRVVRVLPEGSPVPELGTRTGVSAPHPLDQAHLAYQQALAAAELSALDPALPFVTSWHGLGAYRLLIDGGPEEVLGALSEPLRTTLETYLDAGCDARVAAQRLHLHRTSLYYRLGRIAELTGRDLATGAARLELHLALKLVRLGRRA
ncbi:PucR family transcriptional regulator [Umezawaea endophytica]|uniref:Helix-turn-helix domain-containing protein n=1 Tax=Umezawaea endophytica TaxID=1654476 RepID=A0A9X2VL03_9PSEU|nr:helix-turn-helix domain-containing protein [Umezawaea endophytica]MCS7478581.1 helix-turn-helix domain-containing protein [Umezawaea endophytica]